MLTKGNQKLQHSQEYQQIQLQPQKQLQHSQEYQQNQSQPQQQPQQQKLDGGELFLKIWRNKVINSYIFRNLLEICEEKANGLHQRRKLINFRSISPIIRYRLWNILKDMLICNRSMYIGVEDIKSFIFQYNIIKEDGSKSDNESIELIELFIQKKRERLQTIELVDFALMNNRLDLAKIFIKNGIPTTSYTLDIIYSLPVNHFNGVEQFIQFFQNISTLPNNPEERQKIKIKLPSNVFNDINIIKSSKCAFVVDSNAFIIDNTNINQLLIHGKINTALSLIKNNVNNNNLKNILTKETIENLLHYASVDLIKELISLGLDGTCLLNYISIPFKNNNLEMVSFLLDNFHINEDPFSSSGSFSSSSSGYIKGLDDYTVFSGDIEMVKWFHENYKHLLIVKKLHAPFEYNRQSIDNLLKSAWICGQIEVFSYLINQYPELKPHTIFDRKFLNYAIDNDVLNVIRFLHYRGELLNVKPSINKKELPTRMRYLLNEIVDGSIIIDIQLKEYYKFQKNNETDFYNKQQPQLNQQSYNQQIYQQPQQYSYNQNQNYQQQQQQQQYNQHNQQIFSSPSSSSSGYSSSNYSGYSSGEEDYTSTTTYKKRDNEFNEHGSFNFKKIKNNI